MAVTGGTRGWQLSSCQRSLPLSRGGFRPVPAPWTSPGEPVFHKGLWKCLEGPSNAMSPVCDRRPLCACDNAKPGYAGVILEYMSCKCGFVCTGVEYLQVGTRGSVDAGSSEDY